MSNAHAITVTTAELERLQRDAGIPHLPTPLTYELRMAVAGEGPRAYDWADKPHRLLYDACREIERLSAQQAGIQKADASRTIPSATDREAQSK